MFARPWHRSTYVVAAATALVMVVIAFPGEITSPLAGNFGGAYTATYDHGWPLTFLARSNTYGFDQHSQKFFPDIPKWGVPWLAWDSWQIWEMNDGKFSKAAEGMNSLKPVGLFFDLGIAALVTIAAATLWERRRRRSPRILRFSLRDLVVATTAAACLLGWGVHAQRVRRNEVRTIERLDNYGITYEASIAPRWMQRLVGAKNLPEFFLRVDEAYFNDMDLDEFRNGIRVCSDLKWLKTVEFSVGADPLSMPLDELRALPQLRILKLYFDKLSADQIAALAQLRQLRILSIASDDDQDQKELQSRLPNCKVVSYWSDPNW